MRFTAFAEQLERLWELPQAVTDLTSSVKGFITMASEQLQRLQTKIDGLGATSEAIVLLLTELRSKNAALETLVRNGASEEELAAVSASLDRTLDKLAAVVTPVVEDEDVETGQAEVPPVQNPDNPAPEDVHVPDGLPEEVVEDIVEIVPNPDMTDQPAESAGDDGSDASASEVSDDPADAAADNPTSPVGDGPVDESSQQA